jgi:DNA-binding MarR family transcriptional regulator
LISRQSDLSDHVEDRRRQWAREAPDVDTVGMAILGRARWVTLLVRPAIEAVFAKHGLDSGEFDVIATLLRSGPPYRLRPTELYRSLMISSGGLTDRLDRLGKAGLIVRVLDPDDGRSRMVELTPEGRHRAQVAFREDMALERQLLTQLSERDQQELATLLSKLSRAISLEPQSDEVTTGAVT